MKILVTGGLGYIGSHVCLELMNQDHEIITFESFINCYEYMEDEIRTLAKKGKFTVIKGDLTNINDVEELFQKNPDFDVVFHIAALKSVPESVLDPALYYRNNIVGTLNLFNTMLKHKVRKVIFSSSATVYGHTSHEFFTEDMPIGIDVACPYGKTKVICEEIMEDYCKAYGFRVISLRYFNPLGSLMNCKQKRNATEIMSALLNPSRKLKIFGDDYNTRDGTCIRDYTHILDLIDGHIHAMKAFDLEEKYQVFNLGTGRGTTVKELAELFQKARDVKLDIEIVKRREGDVPIHCADVTKVFKVLGWKAKRSLEDALKMEPLLKLKS